MVGKLLKFRPQRSVSRTENPRVGSSILSLGTIRFNVLVANLRFLNSLVVTDLCHPIGLRPPEDDHQPDVRTSIPSDKTTIHLAPSIPASSCLLHMPRGPCVPEIVPAEIHYSGSIQGVSPRNETCLGLRVITAGLPPTKVHRLANLHATSY